MASNSGTATEKNGSDQGANASSMTLGAMMLYALANIGFTVIDNTFDQFVGMLYIDHKFITVPILLGIACFAGRIVDAIANPLVGYWSDRSYGPRGRRIPFIIRGSLPMAFFFAAMFFPISRNTNVNFIQTLICASGMLFFFTYTCAPYAALLPDLARKNDDRVKLSTLTSIAGILGILLAFVAAGTIVKMGIDHFHAIGQPQNEYKAYSIMGASLGALVLVIVYITAFTVKEKPVAKEDRIKLDFWESVIPVFKNRPFIIYAVSLSSFWVGFKVLQTSINFICKYVYGKDEAFGSMVGMGGMIAVWLISTPFVFSLQKKFGKKTLFKYALLMISIVSFAQGFIGVVPEKLGLYFYLGLIFSFGIPFAALLVLYSAIVGDIIDLDAKQMGVRREAMYFGMEGLFTKLARGMGWIIVTGLFQVFGTPSPTNHMAMVVAGPVCGFFAFIGFAMFSRYPLED